jgi:ribose-phosphate pyrophosphokinase
MAMSTFETDIPTIVAGLLADPEARKLLTDALSKSLSKSFIDPKKSLENVRIITTTSHPTLGVEIARLLEVKVVDIKRLQYADTSVDTKFNESVRGCDIIIVASGSKTAKYSVSDNFLELMMICDGCRRAQVKSVTLGEFCFPCQRSDKRDHRGPIGAKVIMNMLEKAGINRIVSFDLHAGQEQGFTNLPFDNIYLINVLSEYITNEYFKKITKDMSPDEATEYLSKFILVAPDLGTAKRVKAWKKKLQEYSIMSIFMDKDRDYTKDNTVEKSTLLCSIDPETENKAVVINNFITMLKGMSKQNKEFNDMMSSAERLNEMFADADASALSSALASDKLDFFRSNMDKIMSMVDSLPDDSAIKHIKLIGMKGLLVDDIIDTMGTMEAGISILETYGMDEVVVIASHGILSDPAIDRINKNKMIKNVIVTDTVDQTENLSKCPKLIVVSIAPLAAEVFRRILSDKPESVSALFT